MTVLRDGTVVDESINAHNFTRGVDVPAVFKCGKRRVEAITIHHWGLPGQVFDAVVKYLASANVRSSSAHAIIMAGRATSIVNPDDAAWHTGSALGNTTTIGLELRPEATEGDYRTAAAYIAMLREVYGDIPLVPHNKWHNTACPGNWDLVKLDKLARQGTVAPQGEVKPPVKPAPAPAPKPPVKPAPVDTRIHWVVERGDTLGEIQKYYNGPTVNQIAQHNGIKNINILNVGQKVYIPGPLVWKIEGPDTIRSIAKYYGLAPEFLAARNKLAGPDATIYIGNVLKIQ